LIFAITVSTGQLTCCRKISLSLSNSDERDSIILSVGYGKDRAGNLPLRFGPILSVGGRRRLNPAVTRDKETMTVVSSFAYTDIDVTKVKPMTGLDFLRNFLQYASSNGRIFAHGELTNGPMNDFEADVYDALTAKGIKLVPQVGCSKFRLDFAACHPTEPGRFVLAIECDGAIYHSSYTARDRDRLRQQQLENLGWVFHRIWSTDWFNRKHEEVDRVVAAYERALSRNAERRDLSVLPTIESPQEDIPDLLIGLMSQRSSLFLPIPKRASIAEYDHSEMKALYDWVTSDGSLRTHEEVADEMFQALPFTRRGARIDATLRETIRRHERSGASSTPPQTGDRKEKR
jgi:very-short-patch-repair endonuclease